MTEPDLIAVALHRGECLEVEMDYQYTDIDTGERTFPAWLDGIEAVCRVSGCRIHYYPARHALSCDMRSCPRSGLFIHVREEVVA